MKNTLRYGVGIIAVLVILFAAGRLAGNKPEGGGGRNAAAAVLSAETTSHDFGRISMADGIVKKIFTISNTTATPVLIEKIYTSCMCTEAVLKTPSGDKGPFGMPGHGVVPSVREEVEAGGTRELVVSFDPAAHGPAGVGRIERLVSVVTDDGGTVEFTIRATVTP